VKLRYFDELSYDEIAKELSAPLGTVKAQLHRARELMYELVKGKKEHI
jgi:DNA-directed RNA polymerase specialized sigma24 family protein